MPGELSHIRIGENRNRCRCGKAGCLETLVNQDILYRQYLAEVRRLDLNTHEFVETEIKRGLQDLFRRAREGEEEAVAIVQRAARYLARGIAILLLILDIPHILISAAFGEDGNILIPYIKEELKGCLLPGMDYILSYYPLEVLGFAHGSAMLILKDYYTSLGE